MKIAVYDNEGKTVDRYTVIIGNAVYGMSHNAMQANGFNQFVGQLFTDIQESFIAKNSKETSIENLPREVIRAIVQRIKNY